MGNVDTVKEFYDRMSANVMDADQLTGYFAQDAYIQPMMKDPYQGREEIRHMFGLWASGYSGVHTRLRNVVGDGDVVMTEWLDESDFDDRHFAIPCTGVFEFDDGKIAAWRIYYDYAMEAPQEGKSGLRPPTQAAG